jgi:hypothetical protein
MRPWAQRKSGDDCGRRFSLRGNGSHLARLTLAIAVTIGCGSLLSGPALAADPVEVVKLVLAEHELSANGQQILQITLRGTGGKPVRAGLRVEMRDDRDARVGKGIDRVVQVNGPVEQREFFRFEAPNRFGRFTVRVEVFTPDFKSRLLAGTPVFYAPFQVGSLPEPGMAAEPKASAPRTPGAEAKAGPPTFPQPKGLTFEKPDLVWENLDIQPPALLVGEPLKVKADLRNVGGDIARGIEVKVDYFNVRTPANLVPISSTTVQVLAPGDKVELEFQTILPDDAPLGDYKVRLQIDPANRIAEMSKQNNILVSEVPLRLSIIKQVFPEPGYYFEQTGLFLFRWDSRKFDEFKVQVGTDAAFTTPDSYFDIPQGDKWTKDREIVPLEGELPDMAMGLMQKARSDQLYWRVVGRISATGIQSVSSASPFAIRKSPTVAPTGGSTMGKDDPPAMRSSGAMPPGPPKDRVGAPKDVEAPAQPAAAPTDVDAGTKG